MQHKENEPKLRNYRLPLFLTTAMVSLILMAGAGLGSLQTKAFEINPSADPTPDLSEGTATATPEYIPEITYTPTPFANNVIMTPIPNAGPVVKPDGSISHNQ